MCLWLITACLGVLPSNPAPPNVIVVGVPTPILTPTTTTTTTTTTVFPTLRPPGNQTGPLPAPPMTNMTMPMPTINPPSNPPATMMTMAPFMVSTVTLTAATPPPPLPPSPTNPTFPPASINTTSSTGGISITLLICNNPNIVCVANPDQTVTGSPMIDPRVGTTPGALPIIAYNAQDTAVRFPRTRRSLKPYLMKNIFNKTEKFQSVRHKRQTGCSCVPVGTCPANNGAGMIDFRIVTPGAGPCPQGQVYCCTGGGGTGTTVACGVRQTVPTTVVTPGAGQASFGEYPWMAILLTNQNDYIAGGVLIDQYNVLTVIHRLTPYLVAGTTPNVKVRLGEWDASGTYEPIPYQEYTIRKVFTHPSYNAATLQYDIAVIRLATPVPFSPTAGSATSINRACLPPSATSVYTGQRCWVSGWGKNAFTQGQYQQIMKEVDVPIVDTNTCQNQLRVARLGANYFLDTTSFICAGGDVNKDSCTGDGGSGLVCQVNGQWVVTGIVTWGLGCAMANVPGVYINVAALLPWIQQQVASN